MKTWLLILLSLVALWLLIGIIRMIINKPDSSMDAFLQLLMFDVIGELIIAILESL